VWLRVFLSFSGGFGLLGRFIVRLMNNVCSRYVPKNDNIFVVLFLSKSIEVFVLKISFGSKAGAYFCYSWGSLKKII